MSLAVYPAVNVVPKQYIQQVDGTFIETKGKAIDPDGMLLAVDR
jgi:hypothetical protein